MLQLILKAIGGINFAEFFRFLHVIGSHRIDGLKKEATGGDESTACTQDSKYQLGSKNSKCSHQENMNICNHLLFDLMQISKVISDMLAIPEFLAAEQEKSWDGPAAADFLFEINVAVKEYLGDFCKEPA